MSTPIEHGGRLTGRRFRDLHLGELVRDRRGLALVETALVLPVLVTLWIGTFEVSRAFQADRRITLATATIADLVSRDELFTDADLAEIYTAGQLLLQPLPTTSLGIRVTSAKVDKNGIASVEWSIAKNVQTFAVGSTLVDASGYEPGTKLIVVDTTFALDPTVPMPPFTSASSYAKRQIAAQRPFPEATKQNNGKGNAYGQTKNGGSSNGNSGSSGSSSGGSGSSGPGTDGSAGSTSGSSGSLLDSLGGAAVGFIKGLFS